LLLEGWSVRYKIALTAAAAAALIFLILFTVFRPEGRAAA